MHTAAPVPSPLRLMGELRIHPKWWFETELRSPQQLAPASSALSCCCRPPLSAKSQGPAWALWVLPGQLAKLLRPSSHHLRDQRAPPALRPSQGPGLQPPLDLPSLHQAVAM